MARRKKKTEYKVDDYRHEDKTCKHIPEAGSAGQGKVAAWFLDHDYNGRTFNISQTFFPDSKTWDKIAKALKTVGDPHQFAHFSDTTLPPFPAG